MSIADTEREKLGNVLSRVFLYFIPIICETREAGVSMVFRIIGKLIDESGIFSDFPSRNLGNG